jgi:hydroxymethylglutaryl-CoA reductase
MPEEKEESSNADEKAEASPKRSDISGFRKLNPADRMDTIRQFAGLSEDEARLVSSTGAMDIETANRMIENVVGTTELPFGVATNFLVNGKDYLVPMCIDEPSVVAAASYAAKLARPSGGFSTSSDEPIMIVQIQMLDVPDFDAASKKVMDSKEELLKIANDRDPMLIKYGGGAKDVEVRKISTKRGDMMIVHLLVNVADAYGPNLVNTMAEALTPKVEELTGGRAKLRIVSNLADRRLARAKAVWKKEVLEASMKAVKMKGEEIVDAILDAYAFAASDPYRSATHNKGIMNGIDAVTIATANDFRGVEAGAHAFAAVDGYSPLTHYERNENGDLVGTIELPLAVGIVGGAINSNPTAKVALKILGVKSARELSEVMASVGLAQNFAALRALSTEGLQRGHMRLHAKNIAIIAGAKGDQIDKVAEKMAEQKNVSTDAAKKILEEMGK